MKLNSNERPGLVRWARLRVNGATQENFLLYPERGLRLNSTGFEILLLCNSVRSLKEILFILADRHDRKPDSLTQEVELFLEALTCRGLLLWERS